MTTIKDFLSYCYQRFTSFSDLLHRRDFLLVSSLNIFDSAHRSLLIAALGIERDRLHYAGDGSARTRLVRLQSASHRGKQSDQLADHYVEHRTILVRKIRDTQRQAIIDQLLYVVSVACGHGEPHPSQALAINLTQQVDLISSAPRFAGEESHKCGIAVDARHGAVAQPE